ncbi:hypothetical protein SMICM17S_05414 [Streptomyces microflavus]
MTADAYVSSAFAASSNASAARSQSVGRAWNFVRKVSAASPRQ